MNASVLSVGIACVIAGIVGGGFKAFGIEVPALASLKRQYALMCFGVLLIAASQFDRLAIVLTNKHAASTVAPVPNGQLQNPSELPVPKEKPQPQKTPAQSFQPHNPSELAIPKEKSELRKEVAPDSALQRSSAHPGLKPDVFHEPGELLVWSVMAKASEPTQRDAQYYCSEIILDGMGGWRLPTSDELHHLIFPEPHPSDSFRKYFDGKKHYLWIQEHTFSDGVKTTMFDTELNGPIHGEVPSPVSPGTLCVRATT